MAMCAGRRAGGQTWTTPVFNDSAACELRGEQLCEAKTGYAIYPTSSGGANCGGNRCGAFHTLGIQNETTGSKGEPAVSILGSVHTG